MSEQPVDLDQTPQHIHLTVLDTSPSSEIDLLKLRESMVKELRCPIIWCKYDLGNQ